MNLTRKAFNTGFIAATALAATLASGSALAQDRYPSKPSTIVVPYAAGGSNDVFARLLAKSLTQSLKQTGVVDHPPGASRPHQASNS